LRHDYYLLQQNLFLNDPFAVEDGKVQTPEGPGWDVPFTPQWLTKADRQVSSFYFFELKLMLDNCCLITSAAMESK